MRVVVHGFYKTHKSFDIEVDNEYEIRDAAWQIASVNEGAMELQDIDWEVIEGEE